MFTSDSNFATARRAIARTGCAVLAAGSVAGCGQKGPLRLPEPLPAAAAASQPAPAASAAKTAPQAPAVR